MVLLGNSTCKHLDIPLRAHKGLAQEIVWSFLPHLHWFVKVSFFVDE